MATRETPRIPALLRASAAWVALVALSVLILSAVWPGTPLGYTPAPIRFVACGSLATLIGVQLVAAFVSGFITVLLVRVLVGRPISPRDRRVASVLVIGTLLFALSFGGTLLVRRSFIGCERLTATAPDGGRAVASGVETGDRPPGVSRWR
jgi:hypothetical protein